MNRLFRPASLALLAIVTLSGAHGRRGCSVRRLDLFRFGDRFLLRQGRHHGRDQGNEDQRGPWIFRMHDLSLSKGEDASGGPVCGSLLCGGWRE